MKQRISSIRRVKSSLSKGIKTKRSPVTKRVGRSRFILDKLMRLNYKYLDWSTKNGRVEELLP